MVGVADLAVVERERLLGQVVSPSDRRRQKRVGESWGGVSGAWASK